MSTTSTAARAESHFRDIEEVQRDLEAVLADAVRGASGDPKTVVAGLHRRVLAVARRSAGLTVLPAEAHLGGERHCARRVV